MAAADFKSPAFRFEFGKDRYLVFPGSQAGTYDTVEAVKAVALKFMEAKRSLEDCMKMKSRDLTDRGALPAETVERYDAAIREAEQNVRSVQIEHDEVLRKTGLGYFKLLF